MSAHQFDTETAVTPLNADAWSGHLAPHWNIGDNPNGGYMAANALAAMLQAQPHPDPLSVTTHFLRPGSADAACQIQVAVVRSGRTLSTVRGTLIQDGKARIELLAAFGDLSDQAGVDQEIVWPMPSIPAPDECPPRSAGDQGVELPILDRLDIRLHPEQSTPGGLDRAEISGWIRFRDGRAADGRALVVFADAFPPAPLGLLGRIGWVPTLELTVQIRRRPAPGWVLGKFQTDDLQGGRMIESGALWDSTGALVAQSRQLGLVRST